MSDFKQCSNQLQLDLLTFGQFSVARKPIINGGARRPTCLLSTLLCSF